MAGLNSTVVSLVDFCKRRQPDGGVETEIAELLFQENEILTDMLWREGNLPTGHRMTMRTGLPTGTWRKFNQGVPNTKSTTAQVDAACAMYEQKGAIDKDLAMLDGATAEMRLSENVAHIEAMNNDMATQLFYGDATTPERFIGFSAYYNSLSAVNAMNILSAGSVSGGDATSIWLIGWGQNSVFGIFPKGSVGGLQHLTVQDGSGDGCTEVNDENGNPYRAFVDRYQWKCGLALKDWRYVVRICNIDVSATVTESSAPDLIKLMSRATDRIKSKKGVKLAFYMNRTIYSMLKIQALNKSVNALSIEEALGQFELRFLGIPIRMCDAIVNNEATVS